MGLIPHWGTRSPLPQLKSLHDKTKTLGNQINKYKFFLKKRKGPPDKKPAWNNHQSWERQSQLRRDQLHSFPLPFPTPPYGQTLEQSRSTGWRFADEEKEIQCLLSPLEASSLGKWWNAALKSSSGGSLPSWIGHWIVKQDCLQLSTIRRVVCYLRKIRKVFILEQGTFLPFQTKFHCGCGRSIKLHFDCSISCPYWIKMYQAIFKK